MKALTIVVLAAMTLPFVAAAQSPASVGDRVRIRQTDGTSVVGTVVEASAREMRLLGPGAEFVIPTGEIRSLERSRGEGTSFAKNFFITSAAGGLVFGILSAASFESCSGFCIGPNSTGEAFVWGLLGGTIITMPIGAIVGLTVKGERWESISRGGSGLASLSFAPGPDGFALRGSIPVGGFRP